MILALVRISATGTCLPFALWTRSFAPDAEDRVPQLSYTRGSVIPCVMTVETIDPQALDLLSAPRSPVVRLLRQITTGEASLSVTPLGGKRLPSLDFERALRDVAAAVWRPDTARKPHKRVLHGEIHLPPGLQPTCRLGKFELTVSVSAVLCSPASIEGSRTFSCRSIRSRCTRLKRLRSNRMVMVKRRFNRYLS